MMKMMKKKKIHEDDDKEKQAKDNIKIMCKRNKHNLLMLS